MANHITLAGLPLVNLKRKPFRTAALTIVVTMLTMAFYGGSLLSMNLEAGLNSMQERGRGVADQWISKHVLLHQRHHR